VSRTLHEEVRFDTEKVTSVDWASYPTLTHLDTPESIEIILVNGDRTRSAPTCLTMAPARRCSSRQWQRSPTPIFDATGVRLRRVPFRNDRVLAALKTAKL
jgi:CO/xanthine dehydrogenase Mo-binding subunit